MKKLFHRLYRSIVAFAVLLLIIQFWCAFQGIPGWFVEWITARDEIISAPPATIVVLGGGGIPSESGLIRCYYGALAGNGLTGVTYIVSLPAEGDPATNSVGRMRDELVMRGVPPSAIRMEHEAVNTRQQAHYIAEMLGPGALDAPLLVVTSPAHMRRALLCFRHEGFTDVAGGAAVDLGVEVDIGKGSLWRYGIWSNLESLVRYTRELTAMAYYRLRGWI